MRIKNKRYILRPPKAGDLGWIVYRHGILYSQEFGWNERFEGLVAKIVGEFVEKFDPAYERCWVAELDKGERAGSVFVVKDQEGVAKLRLLLVEPKARGLGIGADLVEQCVQFSQNAGYKKLILWTNDVLVSARRIYEASGFVLVKEEPHQRFGVPLVGQVWEMKLVE